MHHRRQDLDHVELDRQRREIAGDVLGADLLGRHALDDETLTMDVWSKVAHESPEITFSNQSGGTVGELGRSRGLSRCNGP